MEAESLYLRTVEISKRVLGEEHPDTLGSMSNLAHVYYHQGRYEEAEALLLKTVEAWERVLGKDHPDTVKTVNLLVALYEAWGKPDEAEKWRIRVSESEAEGAKIEVTQYVIAEKNLKIPEPLQACSVNLEKIYAAINKYRKDKGKLPDWLSDLVPDYLGEETLLCPSDPDYKAQYSPRPKASMQLLLGAIIRPDPRRLGPNPQNAISGLEDSTGETLW